MRATVNDLSLGGVQNNLGGMMPSDDDQARMMQNGPMPKKRGNMNPVAKNFNKVPPKRYKAGSTANQAPAGTTDSQGRPVATSPTDSKPLYKIKYINNTAQNSNAQVAQRAHMKPV